MSLLSLLSPSVPAVTRLDVTLAAITLLLLLSLLLLAAVDCCCYYYTLLLLLLLFAVSLLLLMLSLLLSLPAACPPTVCSLSVSLLHLQAMEHAMAPFCPVPFGTGLCLSFSCSLLKQQSTYSDMANVKQMRLSRYTSSSFLMLPFWPILDAIFSICEKLGVCD